MGLLSDRDIQAAMESGELIIFPDYVKPIQPASVDLRLGNTISFIPEGLVVDPTIDVGRIKELRLPFNAYRLYPGESINVSTFENIELRGRLYGILTGKSSLARIHLQIECAGFLDPGWKGVPTLELSNLGKAVIVLRPGMEICQVRFDRTEGTPLMSYGDPRLGSHYHGAVTVEGAYFNRPGDRMKDLIPASPPENP
jgi:dCTP deaminase